MNYRAGHKIFATEKEAWDFSKDIMAYGGIAPIEPTNMPVTHEYLGDLKTQEVRA